MQKTLLCWIVLVVVGSLSCQAQLKNREEDFSIPPQWGPGSLMMQWGGSPETLRKRGEGGMSDKGGKNFGVIVMDDWRPSGEDPYLRSIVSRVVWPMGTVAEKDVGRTVTFTGLFGWYGGQPERSKDLFLAKESGFWFGEIPLQGLKGMQDFEFGSVREKDWEEVTVSYRIRREDVGKDLQFLLQLHGRKSESGLPVLATADWKIKVNP